MPPAPFNRPGPPVGPPTMAPTTPSGTRDTTPGFQPMAGPPMPNRPVLTPPKGNKPHHRSSPFAKGKTNKAKNVIPPAQYGTRAKPQTEY